MIRQLEDNWNIVIENEFADRVTSSIRANNFSVPNLSASAKLCGKCLTFRDGLLSPGFNITYDSTVLKGNCNTGICDLCCLLWPFSQKAGQASTPHVSFQRNGTSILMNGYTLVASIFRTNSRCSSVGFDQVIYRWF